MAIRNWGSEQVVNTNTPLNQNQPRIAAMPDGGFVVVWTDADPAGGDGSGSSIKLQRFDASGVRVGLETLVNTTTPGSQVSADVAVLDNGSFVVAWNDFDTSDIRFRRFAADGTAIDIVDGLAVGTGVNVQGPAIVATAGGGFALAYNEFSGASRDDKLIFIDANGTPGAVNDIAASANDEELPDLAMFSDGSFVAVWEDSDTGFIRKALLTSAGVLVGGSTTNVSNTGGVTHDGPKVAVLANDGFVVTWQDNSDQLPDDQGTAVHAQMFDAAGVEIGTEVVVNTAIAGSQGGPAVVAMPNGGYAIVWTGTDTHGQLFDAFGARIGTEFIVSTTTANFQANAQITVLADGRLAVVWTDGSATGDDTSFAAVRMQIIDPRDGVVTGTANGEVLFGHDEVADDINALGGDDTLNGLAGADIMYGGQGDDIYVVDNEADQAVELFANGTDHVQSSASFTLRDQVENLTLTGAAAVNATGNSSANILIGNGAANVLDGLGGADQMTGGGGNDTYRVDDAGDTVTELSGGGDDLVVSAVTFTLGSNLERLALSGGANVAGIGNSLANVITGNVGFNALLGAAGNDTIDGAAGDDTLRGGLGNDLAFGGLGNDVLHGDSGNDTLRGGTGNDTAHGGLGNDSSFGDAGNDTLMGDSGNDTLRGGIGNDTARGGLGNDASFGDAGNDLLFGDAGADRLTGGTGNDRLNGGLGKDVLIGNAGRDTFSFNNALVAANVDRIADFFVPADVVQLENAVFGGLAGGVLKAAAFHKGAAAHDATDRIIYNATAGTLTFDANGDAAGGAKLFATIGKNLAMTNADFVVI